MFPARCIRQEQWKPRLLSEWIGTNTQYQCWYCRQRVFCFKLLIWKRWFPRFKLRVCTLFDLDREGGARPGFPTNKPNYQAFWPPAWKNPRIAALEDWLGYRGNQERKSPRENKECPRPISKLQDMAWKLLPMLLREHGPSRKKYFMSTKVASQICHHKWVCQTHNPSIFGLVIRPLYTLYLTSLPQLSPHWSLFCLPNGQCPFPPQDFCSCFSHSGNGISSSSLKPNLCFRASSNPISSLKSSSTNFRMVSSPSSECLECLMPSHLICL